MSFVPLFVINLSYAATISVLSSDWRRFLSPDRLLCGSHKVFVGFMFAATRRELILCINFWFVQEDLLFALVLQPHVARLLKLVDFVFCPLIE